MTESVKKCVLKTLPLIFDEACLDILSDYTKEVTVEGQYQECYHCDAQYIVDLPPKGNTSLLINTKYPFKIHVNDSTASCDNIFNYQEYGTYGWNVSDQNCSSIYIKTAPDNAYLPILGAFIIFLLFGTIWYGVKCVYRSGCTSSIRHRLARFSELENVRR